MTEHRRRLDENGNTVHERSTDTDRWARLDLWANHYKIAWGFWLILLTGATWVNTRIVQRLDRVPEIIGRLDYGDSVRVEMRGALIILINMQCLQLSAADRAKLPGFDCRDIPLPRHP